MSDIISTNYSATKQTFIIPLTLNDINQARNVITRIGYGGDLWELRVDLLSTTSGPLADVNLPKLDYVTAQVEALQRMSDLPILFTIRTKSQGGKFPDEAADEALELMLLAVARGVQYIDVEIEWPKRLINQLVKEKGSTKLVASDHSWTGDIRWTSQELQQRFHSANEFGDIIKLSMLSTSVEDCYELGLFVREYNGKYSKPLLAVGMGLYGQLSRITSPISLVTHPLIPFASAPGQLSLAQVNQARHLMGLLPKEFYVLANKPGSQAAIAAFQAGFAELGFPHTCIPIDSMAGGFERSFESLEISNDPETGLFEQFIRWTARQAPSSVLSEIWNSSQ